MTAPAATVANPARPALGWLRRILVLSGHTFTQLVRMKVFYFLVVFTVVIFVVGFLLSSVTDDQELKLVKDTAFGSMQIFSWIFGIVGMALLLPKDLEDRTLYTILSKPVRRFEYLFGKFLGVLAVLFISLAIMDAMASLVLHLKHQLAVESTIAFIDQSMPGADVAEYREEQKSEAIRELSKHALRWELHVAVLVIFLKAAVITAVALLISTFSGSTIFTILAALAVLIIGHLQSVAREAFVGIKPQQHVHTNLKAESAAAEEGGANVPMRIVSGVIAVLLPDFEVYGVVDSIANGSPLLGTDLLKIFGLTAVYLGIYLGVAALLFSEKEL